MSDRKFTGCGTALLTPFKGEEVDYEAFAATVDWQVTTGVDFLVPLGTTGETPTLSDEEKRRVLDVAIRHAAGRQRGMYAYFKAVAEATPKPVILYNVPGRTGANLEAATALALARDVPNIIGIKEASGKPDQIQALLDGRPEGFRVLSGNDSDTFDMMRQGADGVISVASNVFPSAMVDLVRALQRGDTEDAAKMDAALQPLYKALFVEPNPIPAKAAMARLGLMENSLRLPLVPASEATEKILQQTLTELFPWK